MAIARREQTPLAPLLRREFDPFRTMRALLNWDPFQPMVPRSAGESERIPFAPAFDVRETENAYEFTADLPGVKEGDIDINVTGNRMSITGKREEEKVEENETFYCSERSYGSFTRSFTLPEGVNLDEVSAELRDGVLHVHVPKPAESKSTQIPLKVSSSKDEGDTEQEGEARMESEGGRSEEVHS